MSNLIIIWIVINAFALISDIMGAMFEPEFANPFLTTLLNDDFSLFGKIFTFTIVLIIFPSIVVLWGLIMLFEFLISL